MGVRQGVSAAAKNRLTRCGPCQFTEAFLLNQNPYSPICKGLIWKGAYVELDVVGWSDGDLSQATPPATPHGAPEQLLERLRAALRVRYYSLRAERSSIGWTRRYLVRW